MKIRSGDLVKVIAGADRGKEGTVLRAVPKKQRVVVEGVNFVYRHMRKTKQNQQGGRIQKEAPVHLSNVRLVTRREELAEKKKKKKKKATKTKATKKAKKTSKKASGDSKE